MAVAPRGHSVRAKGRQEGRLREDLHGHMWEAQLTRAGLSFQRNGAGVKCGQSQPRAI